MKRDIGIVVHAYARGAIACHSHTASRATLLELLRNRDPDTEHWPEFCKEATKTLLDRCTDHSKLNKKRLFGMTQFAFSQALKDHQS